MSCSKQFWSSLVIFKGRNYKEISSVGFMMLQKEDDTPFFLCGSMWDMADLTWGAQTYRYGPWLKTS